jgi:FkbM family methyltransferase
MSTSFAETTLPNGMNIFCLQEEEVPILYEQIQEYCKNGIELHEGDTVFDVGANIGLFTLWVYQHCKENVKIYAFEPISAIFEVLSANAQRFAPDRIEVFPCGLSYESKIVTFAYHPNATALSTAYKDDLPELRKQLKQTVLRNLKNAPPHIRILRWFPPFLRSLLLDRKLDKAFQYELVSCQLRTISEMIRELNIEQVDLLKVDAEKSELDVLLGIEDRDWLKIKQVVIEVHDLDNRVENIKNLLEKNGLSKIVVEQEPLFKGSELFNLYALRQQSEKTTL